MLLEVLFKYVQVLTSYNWNVFCLLLLSQMLHSNFLICTHSPFYLFSRYCLINYKIPTDFARSCFFSFSSFTTFCFSPSNMPFTKQTYILFTESNQGIASLTCFAFIWYVHYQSSSWNIFLRDLQLYNGNKKSLNDTSQVTLLDNNF